MCVRILEMSYRIMATEKFRIFSSLQIVLGREEDVETAIPLKTYAKETKTLMT